MQLTSHDPESIRSAVTAVSHAAALFRLAALEAKDHKSAAKLWRMADELEAFVRPVQVIGRSYARASARVIQ